MADPPTSENEFIGLWKLYIATLVAQQIKDFGIDSAGANGKKLIALLEEQGLLEANFDLAQVFKQARNYVRRWFIPKSIEGAFAIDPNTGFPTLSGKITPSEPSAELRGKGYVSVDALMDLANRALATSDYRVWVLLDRLDVAFVESHDLEKNALRALFRVCRDFGSYDTNHAQDISSLRHLATNCGGWV